MDTNPNARCPTCRDPILPDFLNAPTPPGTFASSDALRDAVQELLALDPTGATPHPVHGPISGWDVSRVTDMRFLFWKAAAFNQPLNSWNVSNVQTMSNMFGRATSFNQPLDEWDVSQLINMRNMFKGATSFNQDLCSWRFSEVNYIFDGFDMFDMFEGATAFNNDPTTRPPNCPGVFVGHSRLKRAVNELLASDPTGATPHPVHGSIGGWDVSRVTDMGGMFWNATSFNQPLNGWVVSNVKSMEHMFLRAASFNQPLSRWDVKNVKNMFRMFEGAVAFNQPLNSWDVSNVRNMRDMFSGAIAFNQATRAPRAPGRRARRGAS